MTNLDSIFKSREITLPTKVHLVKAMVFPVVMYGCEESWAPKNWCFWIVVWRSLLRVPWTARKSNQSILKELNPEYSLEGLMLKLKLWYFGHLLRRTSSSEKTLMLGKIEGRRRRGWQRMRCLDASPTQWTWVCASSRRWWRTGKPGVLPSMGSQIVGHDWATEQQSGVSSFHFLRNFHIIFHSGCNNLHSHQQCTKVKVKVLVTQSCPTLCEPVNCSPPGSSVYGILQARILEWVAIPVPFPFFRRYSWPRDQIQVSCIAGRSLTIWAYKEALGTLGFPLFHILTNASFSLFNWNIVDLQCC